MRGVVFLGKPLPLLLIIVEKAVVAAAISVAAVLAFMERGRVIDPVSFLFADELAEDPHDALVHWLVSLLPHLAVYVGLWLAIGLGLWALLFAVEAVGLWSERVWAEALVIIETASFLPFEIWDAIRRTAVFGWISLAVNVAVLLYVANLYRQKTRRRPRRV